MRLNLIALTWRTQNIFDESCDVVTDKLARIDMRNSVVVKYDSWIRADVVSSAKVAMNGTINRPKFDNTTHYTASLDYKY